MKPFNLIWEKKSFYKGKTIMIGVSYHKNYVIEKLGIENHLTFFLWKKFKVFVWITK